MLYLRNLRLKLLESAKVVLMVIEHYLMWSKVRVKTFVIIWIIIGIQGFERLDLLVWKD